jgi:SHS2 domain-containing protein
VRLLSALLVAFEVEGRFVTDARCVESATDRDGPVVTLRFAGGRVDRTRERGLVEVKAVTYHGIRVVDEVRRTTIRAYVDL